MIPGAGLWLLVCMLLTVALAVVVELAAPAPEEWSNPEPGSPEAVADGLVLDAVDLPGVYLLLPQFRLILHRPEQRREPWLLVLDGREHNCPDSATARRALANHLRQLADRGALAPGGAA